MSEEVKMHEDYLDDKVVHDEHSFQLDGRNSRMAKGVGHSHYVRPEDESSWERPVDE